MVRGGDLIRPHNEGKHFSVRPGTESHIASQRPAPGEDVLMDWNEPASQHIQVTHLTLHPHGGCFQPLSDPNSPPTLKALPLRPWSPWPAISRMSCILKPLSVEPLTLLLYRVLARLQSLLPRPRPLSPCPVHLEVREAASLLFTVAFWLYQLVWLCNKLPQSLVALEITPCVLSRDSGADELSDLGCPVPAGLSCTSVVHR